MHKHIHKLRNSHTMNFSFDSRRKSIFSHIKIVVHLETKPELRRIPKICSKTKCRICRYASLLVNYFIDSTRGNPEPLTELILAYLHRFQEFFKQYFSRMNR